MNGNNAVFQVPVCFSKPNWPFGYVTGHSVVGGNGIKTINFNNDTYIKVANGFIYESKDVNGNILNS